MVAAPEAVVENGSFELALPPGVDGLTAHELLLEGPGAFLDGDPHRRIARPRAGEVLALRARFLSNAVLRVRSAEDGRDLTDVTVLRSDGTWHRSGAAYPGRLDDARVVCRGRTSPIELAPILGAGPRWMAYVWAPGFAFESVPIEPERMTASRSSLDGRTVFVSKP